jgi:hypothetical protein
MTKKFNHWLHPILISILSLVVLYAHNISEIPFSSNYRLLAFCLMGAILLTFIFKMILGDWQKGALTASLTFLLFFSYGHIYNALEDFTIFNVNLGRHRFLAPLWLILYMVGIAVISRMKKTESTTTALNIMALSAFLLPIYQIITYQISDFTQNPISTHVSTDSLSLPKDQPPPDIYYIILDAYARDDSLLEDYGFDNSSFLKALEESGFYVGYCSRSNYTQTALSLPSSLNMDYIQSLFNLEKLRNDPNRTGGFGKLLRNSKVRETLEELGYITVAFETGFRWTEIRDADIYLSPSDAALGDQQLAKRLTEYEILFLRSTATLLIIDMPEAFPQLFSNEIDRSRDIRRERTLYVLDQLETLPSVKGPKFVFVHIVSPHKPFVFAADGSPVTVVRDDYEAYADQVAYLNSRMETIVRKLINNSNTPPIIVIQGDHGGVHAALGDRLTILNVYYLPGEGKENLYSNISPVNTFRVIFNTFFGGNFELLEDISYYSSYENPYDFEVFPETRPGCPSP